MKLPNLPPDVLKIVYSTRNEALQQACKLILEFADKNEEKTAKILRELAFVIDDTLVLWEEQIEGLNLSPEDQAKARRIIRDVNKKRTKLEPRQKWKDVLGYDQSYRPTVEEVKARYKEMALENHPDRGGDPDKFAKISNAKEEALEYLEGKPKEAPAEVCKRCLGRKWIQIDCPQCQSETRS